MERLLSREETSHGDYTQVMPVAEGPSKPEDVSVIAEISGNHLGRLDLAIELVKEAKSSGAEWVKVQHYKPETITANSTLPEFTIDSGLWAGRRLWDLYKDAMTPWEWTGELASVAKEPQSIFSKASTSSYTKLPPSRSLIFPSFAMSRIRESR